jgi:hypothetical protein
MEELRAVAELYRRVFGRAASLCLRNWAVAGTIFAYLGLIGLASALLAPLGWVGGLLVTLVRSACLGSFLYLVGEIVQGSRLTLEDFPRSFGAHFGEVLAVLFVVWVGETVLRAAASSSPQGISILLAVEIVALVVFNAVPELLYLGRQSALQLFGESYSFVAENWVEWFPPNLLLLAGLWLLLSPGLAAPSAVAHLALLSLYLYFAMLVRGLLFQELYGTTRRSRAFRRRFRE